MARGLACTSLLFTAGSAWAQEPAATNDTYIDGLKSCQAIAADAERLACFDRKVDQMVAASETGEVRVLDREEVTRTRRSLFGFNLPDLGIFGGDDDGNGGEDDELFETTITSARYMSRKNVRFTTAEGAVWEMKNVPRRLRPIEAGDTVTFKPASLGYYFVRINGQMGVKGRRVE